jgi:hypothetical protein
MPYGAVIRSDSSWEIFKGAHGLMTHDPRRSGRALVNRSYAALLSAMR